MTHTRKSAPFFTLSALSFSPIGTAAWTDLHTVVLNTLFVWRTHTPVPNASPNASLNCQPGNSPSSESRVRRAVGHGTYSLFFNVNYHDVITEPMDFHTVAMGVRRNAYLSYPALVQDIQKVRPTRPARYVFCI